MQLLGQTAAELMEAVEGLLPRGAQARVASVAIVVEMAIGEGSEQEQNRIAYGCSDTRAWVARALFQEGIDTVSFNTRGGL